MGVQRLEDIFSIVLKILRAWLYIFGLGTKDGSVEWHTSGDGCSYCRVINRTNGTGSRCNRTSGTAKAVKIKTNWIVFACVAFRSPVTLLK